MTTLDEKLNSFEYLLLRLAQMWVKESIEEAESKQKNREEPKYNRYSQKFSRYSHNIKLTHFKGIDIIPEIPPIKNANLNSFNYNNNFGIFKTTMLPFFICTSKNNNEFLVGLFDKFTTDKLGIYESELRAYFMIDNGQTEILDLSLGKLTFKDKFTEFYNDSPIEAISDLRRKNLAANTIIDDAIKDKHELIKDLIRYDNKATGTLSRMYRLYSLHEFSKSESGSKIISKEQLMNPIYINF